MIGLSAVAPSTEPDQGGLQSLLVIHVSGIEQLPNMLSPRQPFLMHGLASLLRGPGRAQTWTCKVLATAEVFPAAWDDSTRSSLRPTILAWITS